MKEIDAVLSSFRVLDLTDDRGFLCGKILGDLGADVIKIEKPGGDTSRNIGPFYHDIPHPEKSLYWFAYNANKRGITLNIETLDGQEVFKRLVKTAHFVIESFPPGYMDELGLGYSRLSEINPKIILVSITPFGQAGPYRDYKTSDIVGMAMGGHLFLTGDPDRAPLRISFPQAYLHASVQAAVGSMVAHYHRESTGEGQHVDVSIQQSIVATLHNSISYWVLNGVILKRVGPMRSGLTQGAVQRQIWNCKDGLVTYSIYGGAVAARNIPPLLEWIDTEGPTDSSVTELKERNWETFDMAKVSQGEISMIETAIENFFMAHTKAELYEGALKRRIMLTPVNTVKDIAESPQLKAREFWVDIEHPELEASILYPGAFCAASQTPPGVRRRAPLIGEHNLEIYEQELGFSREQLITLKQGHII